MFNLPSGPIGGVYLNCRSKSRKRRNGPSYGSPVFPITSSNQDVDSVPDPKELGLGRYIIHCGVANYRKFRLYGNQDFLVYTLEGNEWVSTECYFEEKGRGFNYRICTVKIKEKKEMIVAIY